MCFWLQLPELAVCFWLQLPELAVCFWPGTLVYIVPNYLINNALLLAP